MSITHTLTSKSQITVPKSIRDHLGIGPGDRAIFRVKTNGEVVIARPRTIEEIRAIIGAPKGDQPLTEREKLIGGYLAKKYRVR